MDNASQESPEGLLYARSADIYLDDFGEPAVALDYYHKALEYGYRESECLEGIARCHMLLGDREQAYRYYSKYVDAGYFSISISINYSFLLIQHERFTDALSCLEKARALSTSREVQENLQKYIDYTKKVIEYGGIPDGPDRKFSEFIERNLPVLRALPAPRLVPFGDVRAEGCAVIVELRRHPWLEHALRNIALFLPAGWSVLVVHGSDNRSFVADILHSWGMADVVAMHDLRVANIGRDAYSQLLKRPDFWDLLPARRALVFQTDAMLLGRGLERFYAWDYIGAPWNDFHVPAGVGNGGFSLRTVAVMKEIASRFGATSPVDEMEDVFFARMLHLHGAGLDPPARLADRQAAFSFCAEWRLRDMPVAAAPLAIHQAWRFHSDEQVRQWFARVESAYGQAG